MEHGRRADKDKEGEEEVEGSIKRPFMCACVTFRVRSWGGS